MIKKSLGQHFLTSQGALNAIVAAGVISKKDTILEIGPGRGILTSKLLEKAGKVIAVEKDTELIPVLETKFAKEIKAKRLILINQDIMEYEPRGDYKLIANIPYYLTGAIMEKFLSADNQPQTIVFLIQKEVAERIVAKNLKESILSISIKAYGEPKYIQTVKAGSFNPPPKVDSAILAINNISKDNFKNIDEQKFFKIMKQGFAHKRKTLGNNLRDYPIGPEVLLSCNIKPSARAEDLTISDWLLLTKNAP